MIISQRISFQELDTNGNGKLDFEEFVTLFYILLDSKGSLTVLLTELQDIVLKAINDFNSCWAFGSAVGAAAASFLCTIM
ncbi:hypothetical protein D8674_009023 [Pyrus ussuriensis x Pyrus communis]|uniref:EF-hand domain-containing protein n=1 Tax=Pyrus ussuriensis x Pyrus communis TaxID=2448454 RepID=A0A5N5I7G5_9ROSA|nr:hypothetical protein D8674_009023 [Pyrus ussuriensis x Pyrus communis]